MKPRPARVWTFALTLCLVVVLGCIHAHRREVDQWDRGRFAHIRPPVHVFCSPRLGKGLCSEVKKALALLKAQLAPDPLPFRFHGYLLGDPVQPAAVVGPPTREMLAPGGACFARYMLAGSVGLLDTSPLLHWPRRRPGLYHARICFNKIRLACQVRVTFPNRSINRAIARMCRWGAAPFIAHELLHAVLGGVPGQFHPTSGCGLMCANPRHLWIGDTTRALLRKITRAKGAKRP